MNEQTPLSSKDIIAQTLREHEATKNCKIALAYLSEMTDQEVFALGVATNLELRKRPSTSETLQKIQQEQPQKTMTDNTESTSQKTPRVYHTSISNLLKFFEYKHLPAELQSISKEFYNLAFNVVEAASDNVHKINGAELATSLRKLLEAKDCAVRAYVNV